MSSVGPSICLPVCDIGVLYSDHIVLSLFLEIIPWKLAYGLGYKVAKNRSDPQGIIQKFHVK